MPALQQTRASAPAGLRPVVELARGRARVTVRNAYDVEKLHARLRFVDARPALRRIAALEEEGFGRSLIVKRLAALAVETGAPPDFSPDLNVRKGRLRADTAAMVMALYERLMN